MVTHHEKGAMWVRGEAFGHGLYFSPKTAKENDLPGYYYSYVFPEAQQRLTCFPTHGPKTLQMTTGQRERGFGERRVYMFIN